MICIILVAGHSALLEAEILADKSGKYTHLIGVPKALLPARPGHSQETILDCWWNVVKSRNQFSNVYLVTNADKYKYFERWATANEFPVNNLINDGTTTLENSLGAVADIELAIRSKGIDDDIMVLSGDMLCSHNFDLGQVHDFFRKKKGELAIYYELEPGESVEKRGIIEMDHMTSKIIRFLEKPKPHETTSKCASVVFYCFRKEILPMISQYSKSNTSRQTRVLGQFMSWLVSQSPVYAMKLPTPFQLIGQIGLAEYEKWIKVFSDRTTKSKGDYEEITCRSYARIGLMGNPSDGFNGKTISLTISNFWADATLTESTKLKLIPHPLYDPTDFGSLSDLDGITRKEGYLGGLRLLQATCKKFYQYCVEHGIALPKKNFTLKYETNVPRQVGLAGSSAIVTAVLRCLMKYYHLSDSDMPKQIQPKFVLDVEKSELCIQAGLQDRVVQVYEGLVCMDFSENVMKQGYGNYSYLNVDIPPLWLAYLGDPSDSGKIHSDVKVRWDRGDSDVIQAMKEFASLTVSAKDALEKNDYAQLADLMKQNFSTRRKIYGDKALGRDNLRMIEIAHKYGSAVKFPGSGGAVIGLCLNEQKKLEMMQEFQTNGFVVCDINPFIPHN
ncbi:uncharacterized protein [Dysidea avara]|uniref:uncharacterized protein n=1 Tax=Dysidea avara TaxID=196820 RepID=UPI0033320A75